MTKIEMLTKETASDEATKIFDHLEKQAGKVPNLYAVAAHSPSALRGILQLGHELKHSQLSHKETEAVAIAIAEENQCHYCLGAHTHLGKMAGLTEEETLLIRQGTLQDEKLRALTLLAKEIVATKGHPSETLVQGFYEVGYSKGALIDLLALVALHIFHNYLDHIAAPELDFPEAPRLDRG